MPAEPERLFSATKLILTDRRNKLSMKMIEALKSWYKLKEFIPEENLFIGPRMKDREGGEVEVIADSHLTILYVTCIGLLFELVSTVKISN